PQIKMKNIGLVFSVILMSFALISQAKQKVTKSNGGQNGYRDITETHDGADHTLKCKNPGRESCTWGQGFSIATLDELEAIDTFVENQLSNGSYSGTGKLSGTNLWFFWLYNEANGTLNYTIAEDHPDYEL
ncbi:MAG TPA: hypothetical protein DIU05_03290, partial [Bacteroidetes bacterium]|nr:hypothetical protein [Bacteroidota bacterium]